ncbi:TVA4 protein, partial [Columbina picui]|nr:TVA4 protein [Columbina picui]
QEPSAETSKGTEISINCSHPSIQTSEDIYWYRQLLGQGPTFLVWGIKGSKALSAPPRQLSVVADHQSSTLWLTRPRCGDVAVYYCAVGD